MCCVYPEQIFLKGNASIFFLQHSIIQEDGTTMSSFNLGHILDEYSKRNVTTKLSNVHSTWTTALGAAHFTANLRIKYPVEILWYRPGTWEVLKHAWTQYLAFLAIFLFLGQKVKEFVFANQILETYRKLYSCHE